jgi:hypothetical protein
MTVTATANTASFTGDASTTEFATGFAFQGTGSTSELTVVERVIATGAETTKSYTSHYTVTGGNGSTGTVIAASAPATTVEWHLRRNTTKKQTTDYITNDPFAADTHETALDRGIMISNELQSVLDRCIKFPETDASALTTTFASSVDRANKNMGFDSNGNVELTTTIGDWKGAWTTTTAYVLNDIVSSSGSSYICIVAHTSGTFATDLTASKWELVAQKGDTGAAGSGDMSDLVDDTSPQLGGHLDVNGQVIGDGTRELLTFTEDGSAVNHVNIENQATGGGPILRSAGDDSNIDLNLESKGTGLIHMSDLVRFNVGADVASTTALPLLKDGSFIDVTGTTTVTSFASTGIGSMICIQFDAALVLTHHSTDLILPGAANITTAAGDVGLFYEYASSDYRCISYQVAATAPGAGGGGDFLLYENRDGATTYAVGAWRTFQLTTEVADSGGDGALSSSVIALGAGTYRAHWMLQVMNGSGVQQAHSRLYNTSDSSTLGMGSYVRLASDETAPSVGVARFTLGSTKNIELQIYTQNQTGSIPAESSVTGEVDLGGFVYLEKE